MVAHTVSWAVNSTHTIFIVLSKIPWTHRMHGKYNVMGVWMKTYTGRPLMR